LNLPRTELAVQRWLEMANEAQDTRRSSHTEQQCNVCRQVVAVGNRGEVGRRMHDGGRDVRTTRGSGGAQEAATEERRWRDGGRNEGWTVVRRWLLPFRRWRDGGCLLFACCSVAEQDRRPKLRGRRRNRRWRGRLTEGTVGDPFAREKMMNSEGSRDLGT